MKDLVKKWFDQTPWREGFLALGVRHGDKVALARVRAQGYGAESLTSGLHVIADVLLLLDKSNLGYGRTCLVYNNALVHAERRSDGICLSVFTARDTQAYDSAGLEKLFSEFQALKLPG